MTRTHLHSCCIVLHCSAVRSFVRVLFFFHERTNEKTTTTKGSNRSLFLSSFIHSFYPPPPTSSAQRRRKCGWKGGGIQHVASRPLSLSPRSQLISSSSTSSSPPKERQKKRKETRVHARPSRETLSNVTLTSRGTASLTPACRSLHSSRSLPFPSLPLLLYINCN